MYYRGKWRLQNYGAKPGLKGHLNGNGGAQRLAVNNLPLR